MVNRRRRLAEPFRIGGEIFSLLKQMGGRPEKALLQDLWDNWETALGADLASMAQPLGSRGRALIVGASDAMQAQELHFRALELVGLANAFLRTAYFEEARVSLARAGKNCRALSASRDSHAAKKSHQPAPTGVFLAQMDKNSPVAACYAAFVHKR